MGISEGSTAMTSWYDMVFNEGKDIRDDLLTYCKLDTLAMVEIYKEIKRKFKTLIFNQRNKFNVTVIYFCNFILIFNPFY